MSKQDESHQASPSVGKSGPTIAALVPMRHHSQRVPGKNYRPFCGQPLYHHILRNLLDCPYVNGVWIDTDSDFIKQDATAQSKVHIIDRPEDLRSDLTPMNDILLYDVTQVEADYYLQTHSTNPLLTSQTISKAVERFLADYPMYDSLFSVTRLQTRLWDSLGRAINHNPSILLRTQDLPPVYEENSCLYLFTRETLERRHNRIGERPLMYEIDPVEAWDIDEEQDFRIGELLFAQREKPS
jgi:CMP-N-acetylneuraminic acid synthetase